MTFDEFWEKNYAKDFGECEPYYGIASHAFETGQQNCDCVNTDNSAVIENLQNENEQLLKMVDHYKDTLKKVRIVLIQERCANICNGVDAQKWFGNIIEMIGDK